MYGLICIIVFETYVIVFKTTNKIAKSFTLLRSPPFFITKDLLCG